MVCFGLSLRGIWTIMVGGRRRGSTGQSILFHPHTGSRESEWEVWSGNKSSESVPSDVPSVTRLYLLKFPQPLKHMSPWKTFPIQISSLSLMNWVHQFLYNTECWKSHFFIHSLSRAKEWFVIITRNKTRMKKKTQNSTAIERLENIQQLIIKIVLMKGAWKSMRCRKSE